MRLNGTGWLSTPLAAVSTSEEADAYAAKLRPDFRCVCQNDGNTYGIVFAAIEKSPSGELYGRDLKTAKYSNSKIAKVTEKQRGEARRLTGTAAFLWRSICACGEVWLWVGEDHAVWLIDGHNARDITAEILMGALPPSGAAVPKTKSSDVLIPEKAQPAPAKQDTVPEKTSFTDDFDKFFDSKVNTEGKSL